MPVCIKELAFHFLGDGTYYTWLSGLRDFDIPHPRQWIRDQRGYHLTTLLRRSSVCNQEELADPLCDVPDGGQGPRHGRRLLVRRPGRRTLSIGRVIAAFSPVGSSAVVARV